MIALLLAATLGLRPPDDLPDDEAIRAAVDRALPRLIATATEYPKHRDCFSCHHQAVPTLALTIAGRRGFAVDAGAIEAAVDVTETDLGGAAASYRRGEGQGGGT